MTHPLNILITGATSGLGRDAALTFARQGHRVFATGRRKDALDALREEVPGTRLEAILLDVTDPASIDAARIEVDRLTDGHGLDALVNNAGYGQLGPLDMLPDAALRAQFETNVFGLVAVTRAFVPAMRRRGAGRIVNLSSLGGRVTFPFMGAYNASKYAVEALSDAMRLELAPSGIQVVLIEPGYIRTNFTKASVATLPDARDESPWAAQLSKVDEVISRFDATGVGPDVVTRAIERAITARRPRARYLAPFSAGLAAAFFGLAPTRLVDWLLSKAMSLQPAPLQVVHS